MSPPQQEARQQIDALLVAAGWHIQDAKGAHIHVARGVSIREVPLSTGYSRYYLLYIEGKAAGVVKAKKVGTTLAGVEIHSARYTGGSHQDCPTGTTRSTSVVSRPASKPVSPKASIANRAPGASSPSITPGLSSRGLMPLCFDA